MIVARLYREIQLQGSLMNDILQYAVTIKMVTCIVMQAVCVAALVYSVPHMKEHGHIAVLTGMIIPQTLGNMFVLGGGMAWVYELSRSVLRSRKQEYNSGIMCFEDQRFLKNWRRKYFASCAYLKVKIGQVNYFEGSTTLVCLNVSTNLTVNLLLVK